MAVPRHTTQKQFVRCWTLITFSNNPLLAMVLGVSWCVAPVLQSLLLFVVVVVIVVVDSQLLFSGLTSLAEFKTLFRIFMIIVSGHPNLLKTSPFSISLSLEKFSTV